MSVVPALTPVTTPVVEFTAAFDGVLLAHVPPLTEGERVVVRPMHTTEDPLMVAPVASLMVSVRVV